MADEHRTGFYFLVFFVGFICFWYMERVLFWSQEEIELAEKGLPQKAAGRGRQLSSTTAPLELSHLLSWVIADSRVTPILLLLVVFYALVTTLEPWVFLRRRVKS